MKVDKQEIINRVGQCNCGCGGKDPWHRQTYRRIVTYTGDTTGTVRMPYSTKPVVVTRRDYGFSARLNRQLYGAWIVDRDSITFDK